MAPLRDTGLLLVAHGSSRATRPQRVAHIDRLADKALFGEVGVAFLKGSPSLAEALAALKSPLICVAPLLMADGIIAATMRHDLADAGGGRTLIYCPPIGLSPQLHEIIARRVLSLCWAQGLDAKSVNVLLVGHGAKADPASHEAARAHAARLGTIPRFAAIATAFLEEAPSVATALAALAGDVVVVGLFAGGGAHAERDLPAQIEAARSNRPGALIYAGAIGDDPDIAELIVEEARRALAAGTPENS